MIDPKNMPEATYETVGREALTTFVEVFCMGKSELISCAEACFYWFNKVAASQTKIVDYEAVRNVVEAKLDKIEADVNQTCENWSGPYTYTQIFGDRIITAVFDELKKSKRTL